LNYQFNMFLSCLSPNIFNRSHMFLLFS
jgi:hypothetical protein